MREGVCILTAYDACDCGSAITQAILDAACADEYRAAGKLVKTYLDEDDVHEEELSRVRNR